MAGKSTEWRFLAREITELSMVHGFQHAMFEDTGGYGYPSLMKNNLTQLSYFADLRMICLFNVVSFNTYVKLPDGNWHINELSWGKNEDLR